MGADLAKIPGQLEVIERIKATHNSVLAGPVKLVEGGTALINFAPIFLSPGNTAPEGGPYWGSVTTLIREQSLYDEANLKPADNNLQYAVRGRDGLGSQGEIFFGETVVFERDPVTLEVTVPNGSWQLAAAPRAGWVKVPPYLIWLRLGGGLVSLLAATLAFILVREPVKLRQAMKNTQDANAKLKEEITERMKVETALREYENDLRQAKEKAEVATRQKVSFGQYEPRITNPSEWHPWLCSNSGKVQSYPRERTQRYPCYSSMRRPSADSD